jgi:hypothetical protein
MLSANPPSLPRRPLRAPALAPASPPAGAPPAPEQVEELLRTLLEMEGSPRLKLHLMLDVLEQYFRGASSRDQLARFGWSLRERPGQR